jgi:parallel beta-helix repeat protein
MPAHAGPWGAWRMVAESHQVMSRTKVRCDCAVIDAHGQKPLKIGSMKLPGSIGIGVLATHNVRVSGFKVRNAGFDAILVALSSRVSVSHNVLKHNGDVGVDLNGSSWSQATGNVAEDNTGRWLPGRRRRRAQQP